MRVRTRHPHLAAIACRIYGTMILLYPKEFRRSFEHELIITFRNQVEDALNGGVSACFSFAGHIASDWVRTWGALAIEPPAAPTVSLLGLGARVDRASGSIDRSLMDVSFVFAVGGVVLMVVGWYTYIATLAFYLG